MKITIKQKEFIQQPDTYESRLEIKAVSNYGQVVFESTDDGGGVFDSDSLATIEEACELLGFELEVTNL